MGLFNKTPWTNSKCTATNRAGKQCSRQAMKGYKVCHYHGARGGRPPKHQKNKGYYFRALTEEEKILAEELFNRYFESGELIKNETNKMLLAGVIDSDIKSQRAHDKDEKAAVTEGSRKHHVIKGLAELRLTPASKLAPEQVLTIEDKIKLWKKNREELLTRNLSTSASNGLDSTHMIINESSSKTATKEAE